MANLRGILQKVDIIVSINGVDPASKEIEAHFPSLLLILGEHDGVVPAGVEPRIEGVLLHFPGVLAVGAAHDLLDLLEVNQDCL